MVDVSDVASASVECVAVRVHVGARDTTSPVFMHVRAVAGTPPSSVGWLAALLGDECVISGGFNAHHSSWGSSRTNPRGNEVLDSICKAGLIILNDGSPALPMFAEG